LQRTDPSAKDAYGQLQRQLMQVEADRRNLRND
jgi:hypothetical protein